MQRPTDDMARHAAEEIVRAFEEGRTGEPDTWDGTSTSSFDLWIENGSEDDGSYVSFSVCGHLYIEEDTDEETGYRDTRVYDACVSISGAEGLASCAAAVLERDILYHIKNIT